MLGSINPIMKNSISAVRAFAAQHGHKGESNQASRIDKGGDLDLLADYPEPARDTSSVSIGSQDTSLFYFASCQSVGMERSIKCYASVRLCTTMCFPDTAV